MNDTPILYTIDTDLAILTLNRPDQRNALNLSMWRSIPELIERAANDPAVRTVIVTGTGGAFAAGADISEFDQVYGTAEATAIYQAQVEQAMCAIESITKPVIALIQGACVGGGCGLALACDLRVAEEGARFGITPAKLGLVYGPRDIRRLVNAVGLSTAKDMLFSGRLMSTQDALAIRLIDVAVPADQGMAYIRRYCAQISANAPWAMGAMKQVLTALAHENPATDELGNQLAAIAPTTPDFAEGRKAFMEKRAPKFTGLR
jgi:enoyl-CoA hydratase/carnithine racemase